MKGSTSYLPEGEVSLKKKGNQHENIRFITIHQFISLFVVRFRGRTVTQRKSAVLFVAVELGADCATILSVELEFVSGTK